MAKRIMIQGTMSNAGKSLLVAGLCRIFKQDGYRVAPFKSQNMALNSYITEEGLEMGRAQVMQAEAAGIKPQVCMNPILLKPTNDTGSQVIVNGEVLKNMKARDYFAYKKKLIPDILKAYQTLEQQADIIVVEGAGSPAEINLKENDIVNMGLAELLDAPVLLVGDIDRGGVFAQLIGTLVLLEEKERERIKGLIINKFRGDVSILDPGIQMLEEKGGIPVTGVVPYMHLVLEDEDSLSDRFTDHEEKAVDIAVIRFPRISNFTDFMVFESIEGVSVRYIDTPEKLHHPDMIILPGSKNTMGDLKWMRQNGLEAAIKKHAQNRDAVIFGICGGYQMLGECIADPYGVEEGGMLRGMELLPMVTEMEQEKTRTQVDGEFEKLSGVLSVLSGMKLTGYEIHMGASSRTDFTENEMDMAAADPCQRARAEILQKSQKQQEMQSRKTKLRRYHNENLCYITDQNGMKKTDGICKGNIYGTYVHGVFDADGIAAKIVEALAAKKGISMETATLQSYQEFKETQYDKLADTLREYLDMDAVYQMMGMER